MHVVAYSESNRRGERMEVLDLLWVLVLLLAQLDFVLLMPATFLGFHLSYFRIAFLAVASLSLIVTLKVGRIRVPGSSASFWLLCAWLGWTAISGLWSAYETAYVRYITIAITYSALVVIVYMIARSQLRYQFILRGLFLLMIGAVALGIYESFTGFRLVASRQWMFRDEITSLFVNPAHFSAAIAMFSPFVLQRIMGTRIGGFHRPLALAVISILGFYLMVHTGSRGVMMGLAVAITSVLLLTLRNAGTLGRVFLYLALGLAAYLLLVPLLPEVPTAMLDKLSSLADLREFIAGSDRVVLMQAASRMWQESPLIGWGAGAAEQILTRVDPLTGVFSVHSWIFELLVNTGLIGALLFAAFYLSLLVGLLKACHRAVSSQSRYLAASLFAGLMAVIPISFVLGSLLTFPLFWVYMGLALSFLRLHAHGVFDYERDTGVVCRRAPRFASVPNEVVTNV